MSQSIQGGCACGAVRYEITGEPGVAFNCHCKMCQKVTGSGYLPGMAFRKEGFKLLQGQIKGFKSTGDSGGEISRSFCVECGSIVVAELSKLPGMIGISAGTLDDSSIFQPMMDIYVSHANSWDHMNPDLPKFPEGPPQK